MTEDSKKIIYTMMGVSKFHNNKPVLKDISLSYFYGAKIGCVRCCRIGTIKKTKARFL